MTQKEDLEALKAEVASLKDQLLAKEAGKVERTLEVKAAEVPSEEKIASVLDGPSDPVPSSFRSAVDLNLNKDFGVHLKGLGGAFKFTVLVPDRYSTLNAEQRKMMGFDMRPKVIDNAEGVNGVNLWCQRVYSSFNPAVQAQITSDRIQNP